MHPILRNLVFGLALAWGAGAAEAQAPAGQARYALDAQNSSIRFSIGHFLVSATEGRFTAFDGRLSFPSGAPERGTVIIHVSPASIDTGIAARDEHLRTADFFDVARYPSATFESSGLVVSGNSGRLTGQLTLHGVTRPVSLDVTLQSPDRSGEKLDFTVQAKLKRSDFGMNGYQGMIGDEVTLKIAAVFVRAP